MTNLPGFQRTYLRGRAHALSPVVIIGHHGLSPNALQEIDRALDDHELIKLKFVDFKGKAQKAEILGTIAAKLSCEQVGLIGHVAILFRPQRDPEKRRVHLLKRAPGAKVGGTAGEVRPDDQESSADE